MAIADAVDADLQLPLRLQMHCCGEWLWAYDEEPLAWLRDFVSARLRERVA